jgi:hypothetical protein
VYNSWPLWNMPKYVDMPLSWVSEVLGMEVFYGHVICVSGCLGNVAISVISEPHYNAVLDQKMSIITGLHVYLYQTSQWYPNLTSLFIVFWIQNLHSSHLNILQVYLNDRNIVCEKGLTPGNMVRFYGLERKLSQLNNIYTRLVPLSCVQILFSQSERWEPIYLTLMSSNCVYNSKGGFKRQKNIYSEKGLRWITLVLLYFYLIPRLLLKQKMWMLLLF